ncbi:DUF3135 domain-containing protein [Thermodesulfatator autotrophicus]|uniref:DUF3135 domain-containing protein n=1 Tax=Thermodesulfatator autotrophicus TaxID=1795632 RepID=A0A177E7S6_9BACT|nr:DUF3135 domain-containing protein [Thermodesulfatator autotrophicus]OAG27997.1 hypothetical protein TH606_03955 [Thermodesulfatator autotrophicus]
MINQEHFDDWFEKMARLAREDPEAFEKERQALIDEAISRAPTETQEKLRKFQWRIDMERKKAKTPLGACIRLYDMLLDMVYGKGGFLESLETLKAILTDVKEGRSPSLPSEPKTNAKIIPFPMGKAKGKN